MHENHVSSARHVWSVAARSAVRTVGLAASGRLRWRGDLVGHVVLGPDGHLYRVFRDTGRRPTGAGDLDHAVGGPLAAPATYVAGFRLAWLGPPASWRHRLFRRVCIVTVPLFSGCPGYRRKLWLAEVGGPRYLGIYQWDDAMDAASYDLALRPILDRLSVRGSAHGTVLADRRLHDHVGRRSPEPGVALPA
jgi:hypothetical protein